MTEHQFGGPWTEQKLKALHAYLVEYQKIFKRNPKARYYKTIYVDAFAGTGERDTGEDESQAELFGYDEDIRKYQEGSVKIALSLKETFDRYVFLDKKKSHVARLRQLVDCNGHIHSIMRHERDPQSDYGRTPSAAVADALSRSAGGRCEARTTDHDA